MNETNKSTKFQSELNNLIKTVKAGRSEIEKQIKTRILDGQWVNDAKKLAEKQGREIKKMLGPDIARAKAFVEKELNDLDQLQNKLPKELKRVRTFINGQVKEIEKAFKKIAVQAKKQAVKKQAKGTSKVRKTGSAKKTRRSPAKRTAGARKVRSSK